jgi:DNA-binding XRE family transcriptional regulator
VRPSDLAFVVRTRADLKSGEARRQRESAGVSAAEIAAVAGVSRQSVGGWETGKSVPSAVHALAYGKALAAAVSGAAA